MTGSTTRSLAARLPALALIALCTMWALPASAADDSTIDNAQPADGAVQLLVSVPGAEPVDLASVSVEVDGDPVKSQAVAAASSDEVKRTTVLAIDTSNSMRGARIEEAKKAALAYLAAVPANVNVGVVSFDDNVKVLVPPGLDREVARTAVQGLTLTRDTALYDGVLGALEAAGPKGVKSGQRKILVHSDGKDSSTTSLDSVLAAGRESGATVDVVSLQQGDEGSQPLIDIANAGQGTVIDTQDPAALTAAFASEADALARQIIVTAQLPDDSTDTSANVEVTTRAGATDYTAAAFVPVRLAAEGTDEPVRSEPVPVGPSLFAIPEKVMLGGVGAMGLGLIGGLVVLAVGSSSSKKSHVLSSQMGAYGAGAQAGGAGAGPARGQAEEVSLGDQAKQAAARALSNNKTLEARIASRLEGAGMSLKPAEWLLVHAGIAVMAGLMGVLLSGGKVIAGLLFVFFGIVGPWLYLGIKKSRRLKAFGSGLADTLQLMSGSLSAGLSLAQSIDTIVREGSEPIAGEFKRVVIETRLGVTLEDSLEGVGQRMESRDFEWVVMAIRIQREVGGNLAELLLTVAATLRERDYLRRHVRALSAEGRLSCYVLGGLPPGFLGYLSLSKPDYVQPMFTTPLGWMMCAGMGVLLGVGILWMSKVAKVDL